MVEMMKKLIVSLTLLVLVSANVLGQGTYAQIINVESRNTVSLDGDWKYLPDQQCIGLYYNKLIRIPAGRSYFADKSYYDDPTTLVEYSFDRCDDITVPGDWNIQNSELMYYEGYVWYRKKFDYARKDDTRVFLYFGAVNYTAEVALNGTILGKHEGGFTPFNFEVTDHLKDGENTLVVLVDNTRRRESVPTITADWWNYGGITRSVKLVETPKTFVRDYSVQYDKDNGTIYGYVNVDGAAKGQKVKVSVPELKIEAGVKTDKSGHAEFKVAAAPELWSPESPKLYDVRLSTEDDVLDDRIGFRYIETKGNKLYLNGKEIFCRGVCMHEESLRTNGRITSHEQNVELLSLAKEMGCNFVRLAHYPYNEDMVRTAEAMGLMVWEEIPLYWCITWDNPATYANAENQLTEIITRDINRANIIIWSVANETPVTEERTQFLSKLIDKARELDGTRLVSAAMEVHKLPDGSRTVKDPLSEKTDLLSFNAYMGWYVGNPEICDTIRWVLPEDKPVFISEFGCGAVAGLHDRDDVRFSEEFMERCYRHNIVMFENMPGLCGTTPWILADFRSPRRILTDIQDNFNRKGLVSEKGYKKSGFYVMKEWYERLRKRYEAKNRIYTDIPEGYLEEADNIPAFWISTTGEVNDFLRKNVHKGKTELLGYSAGGRPIYGVTYGIQRQNDGTTTYSGSISVNNIGTFRGSDSDKKVFMAFGAVHGFEIEPIVGIMNLISVFETGKDLNGTEWPEITSMLDSLDRIVLVPLCNPDGRDRVPVRMEKFRGSEVDANHVHEWLNTGGYADGTLIGWPDCKKNIPLDFSTVAFPGGYPNDNGVNIMHDDFFGDVQPETRILFDLVSREKPDITLNMHCGVGRTNPFIGFYAPNEYNTDPVMVTVASRLRDFVYPELIERGFSKVKHVQDIADVPVNKNSRVNLSDMITLHAGGFCATVEASCHGWTGINPDGSVVDNSPINILHQQLILLQESMKFLSRNGGVESWKECK